MRVTVWCAIATTLLFAAALHGGAAGGDDAAFVFAGFQNGREKLRSGKVSVRQNVNATRPEQAKSRFVTQYFVAFDFDKGLFRFDYEVIGQPKFRGKIIRTPEKASTLASDDGYLAIDKADRPAPFFFRPFDVRNIGLLDFTNLTNEEHTFEGILQRFSGLAGSRGTVEDATINERSVTRLSFCVDQKQRVRASIDFDRTKDYVPVHFEIQSVAAGQATRPPSSVVQVEWKCVSQVWVPIVMTFDERLGLDSTTGELLFSWEAVNCPIDQAVFSDDELVNDRTTVIDRRRTRPIVLRVGRAVTNETTKGRRYGLVVAWNLVAITLIVVSVIGVRIFRFWIRKKRSSTV